MSATYKKTNLCHIINKFKMTNQKGFAHFLVLVIVLAVILAGGWFYARYNIPKSDSPDKYYVANIKRCPLIFYTCPEEYQHFTDNKGCGCEMSSPTTYEAEVSDWNTYRNEEYGFSFRYPENIYQVDDRANLESPPKVFLTLDPNESTPRGISILEDTSMDQQVNEMKEVLVQNDNLIKETKTKVGGVDGVLLHYRDPLLETETTIVFVEHNQYAYRFDWIEDQILSTFEFTN